MGFVRKFLSGGFGLAITYWVGGVLVGNILGSLLVGLVESSSSLTLALSTLILVFLYHVCYTVAVWRAANAYHGPKGWAIAVKVIVVLGWIYIAFAFGGLV